MFLINYGFETLPVTSQQHFPALQAGESGSLLTIGSAFASCSNVTIKYLLMLFNHDIEFHHADERQNVKFPVP